MKIYSFFNFSELGKCFFWGYDEEGSSLISIKLSGEDQKNILIGRSDVSLQNFEFLEQQAVFFSSGWFYGFVEGAFEQVDVERLGTGQVVSKKAQSVPWNRLDSDAVELYLQEPSNVSALDYFRKNNQLFALSLLFFDLCSKGRLKEGDLNNDYLGIIGEAIRKSSMASIGAPLLNKMSRGRIGDYNYARVFDLICDGLDHNQSSYRLCLESLESIGETYWYHMNMGHYYFCASDRLRADSHYAMAARLLEDDCVRNIHFNNGVFTWRSQGFCENVMALSGGFDAQNVNSEVPGQVKAVHLVGCDSGYFEKFGNLIVGSSVKNGPKDILVHVVIVNPSEEALETLEAWASREDCHVDYSVIMNNEVSKPYYTCLRFLKAPEIMAAYDLPVFITDVDMAIQMGWDDVIEKTKHADVGYVRKFHDKNFCDFIEEGVRPWDVAANTIFINNSDIGKKFAKFVSEYIKIVLRFPEEDQWYRYWGIDQVALRQGIETVVSPAFAVGVNLRKVPFVARPRMHIGGKERLLKDSDSYDPRALKL